MYNIILKFFEKEKEKEKEEYDNIINCFEIKEKERGLECAETAPNILNNYCERKE